MHRPRTIGSAEDWREVAEAFERERDRALDEVERLREALALIAEDDDPAGEIARAALART